MKKERKNFVNLMQFNAGDFVNLYMSKRKFSGYTDNIWGNRARKHAAHYKKYNK